MGGTITERRGGGERGGEGAGKRTPVAGRAKEAMEDQSCVSVGFVWIGLDFFVSEGLTLK